MKKLLITGFEAFGGEEINPSWEAVKRLPQEINGYSLTKLQIPVVFGEAAKMVIDTAEKEACEVLICVGQAGGRSAVTPELVAINLRDAKIPDNKGNKPQDEVIIDGGENAYFSTLLVRKMAEKINDRGISSQISYSAGAYVCNDVLYSVLHHFKKSKTRACFIHVPYCKEQGKDPSMDMDDIVKALITAIENID